MALDRRELILARLAVILAGIEGVVASVRNRGELPAGKRPATTLLDADEIADERDMGKGRLGASPNRVVMAPEIYVVIPDQKPDNATAGAVLNSFRGKILKAVLLDEQLLNYVGTNGSIRYDGCSTDLANGRTMNGEMGISVSFVYVLNPAEL